MRDGAETYLALFAVCCSHSPDGGMQPRSSNTGTTVSNLIRKGGLERP